MNERIQQYWSARAQEFSRQRMLEYDSLLKTMYDEIISPCIPAQAVTALDIGTGAGFFAMLFAERGLRVDAIDYSEAMLCEAKANAAKRSLAINFTQMDAQKLAFPADTFDFIFTRNVTWTLEDPAAMYQETARVLKKGGVLVNIDANYGKAFFEADLAGEVPTHPTQAPELLRERNAMTRQLYISSKERPQWDIDCLSELGFAITAVDTSLDDRLQCSYHRATIAASQTRQAPMFLIAVKKD
jgi:ubiquinone/menaquinone biosynthesis C-methylase UbiE